MCRQSKQGVPSQNFYSKWIPGRRTGRRHQTLNRSEWSEIRDTLVYYHPEPLSKSFRLETRVDLIHHTGETRLKIFMGTSVKSRCPSFTTRRPLCINFFNVPLVSYGTRNCVSILKRGT